MSLRLSSFAYCLTLFLFGAANPVLNVSYAQGDSHHKRSIEFSETNNTEVLSKLNQLNNESETARGLQEEWSRPWESRSIQERARRAAGAPYAPPSTPRISTRRMKDLLDRQKNWMVTSDDLVPGNSKEDWMQTF